MGKKDKSRLLAAIDVGSHALSMKIVEVDKAMEVKVLEHLRRSISLGRDTFAMGKVSFETVEETCEILKGFKQLMLDYNIKTYRAVATSAVREAQNRDYIVDQIKLKTGLNIDVIGNSEERFLTYKALRDKMQDYRSIRREGAIVVDIGFGSIQVSIYDNDRLTLSQNIKLGSLRIREVLSTLEGRTLNFPRILEEYIAGSIDTLKLFQNQELLRNFIALGGETRIIGKLCNKSGEMESLKYILKERFEEIYRELMYKSMQVISKDYSVPQESADLLLPSMMIFKKFLDITTAEKVYTPMVSLVDGVVSDMCCKKFNIGGDEDFICDILSSARFIAERYRYDSEHAKAVEEKALCLFDALGKLHGLGERERLLLQLAAILHDTGKFINSNEHYVHSYEIVMASDLLGISKEELEIVANVSRYHSSIVPTQDHPNFEKMDKSRRLVVAKLAAIIRIADALDRSHRQKVKNMRVNIEDEEVVIRVETASDMLLEEWTFETKAEFFQEVFGVAPVLKTKRKVGYAK